MDLDKDKLADSGIQIVFGILLAIWSIIGGFGVYYLTNNLLFSIIVGGLVLAYYMYALAYTAAKKVLEKAPKVEKKELDIDKLINEFRAAKKEPAPVQAPEPVVAPVRPAEPLAEQPVAPVKIVYSTKGTSDVDDPVEKL